MLMYTIGRSRQLFHTQPIARVHSLNFAVKETDEAIERLVVCGSPSRHLRYLLYNYNILYDVLVDELRRLMGSFYGKWAVRLWGCF